MTLDEVLAMAGEQGVEVALARGRMEEARARQTQAGRRFQENPTVEVEGGYRRADRDFLDFEAVVSQGLAQPTFYQLVHRWRERAPRLLAEERG